MDSTLESRYDTLTGIIHSVDSHLAQIVSGGIDTPTSCVVGRSRKIVGEAFKRRYIARLVTGEESLSSSRQAHSNNFSSSPIRDFPDHSWHSEMEVVSLNAKTAIDKINDTDVKMSTFSHSGRWLPHPRHEHFLDSNEMCGSLKEGWLTCGGSKRHTENACVEEGDVLDGTNSKNAGAPDAISRVKLFVASVARPRTKSSTQVRSFSESTRPSVAAMRSNISSSKKLRRASLRRCSLFVDFLAEDVSSQCVHVFASGGMSQLQGGTARELSATKGVMDHRKTSNLELLRSAGYGTTFATRENLCQSGRLPSSPKCSPLDPQPLVDPSDESAARAAWRRCCKEIALYSVVLQSSARALAVELSVMDLEKLRSATAAERASRTAATNQPVVHRIYNSLPSQLTAELPTIMRSYCDTTLMHQHASLLHLVRVSASASERDIPSEEIYFKSLIQSNGHASDIFGQRRGLFYKLPEPLISLGARLLRSTPRICRSDVFVGPTSSSSKCIAVGGKATAASLAKVRGSSFAHLVPKEEEPRTRESLLRMCFGLSSTPLHGPRDWEEETVGLSAGGSAVTLAHNATSSNGNGIATTFNWVDRSRERLVEILTSLQLSANPSRHRTLNRCLEDVTVGRCSSLSPTTQCDDESHPQICAVPRTNVTISLSSIAARNKLYASISKVISEHFEGTSICNVKKGEQSPDRCSEDLSYYYLILVCCFENRLGLDDSPSDGGAATPFLRSFFLGRRQPHFATAILLSNQHIPFQSPPCLLSSQRLLLQKFVDCCRPTTSPTCCRLKSDDKSTLDITASLARPSAYQSPSFAGRHDSGVSFVARSRSGDESCESPIITEWMFRTAPSSFVPRHVHLRLGNSVQAPTSPAVSPSSRVYLSSLASAIGAAENTLDDVGASSIVTYTSSPLSPYELSFSIASLVVTADVGIPRVRDEMELYLKKKREAVQQARLKALRTSDTDAYMAHLSEVKISSLLKIMETTHQFMLKVGAQLTRKGEEEEQQQLTKESALSDNNRKSAEGAADAVLHQHAAARAGRENECSDCHQEDEDYRRFKEYVKGTKDEYKLVHKVDTFVPFQPAGLRATLMPHQLVGLRFLASLHANGINGILADEMGVGKTIQTLAFLLHLKEQRMKASGLPIIVEGGEENEKKEEHHHQQSSLVDNPNTSASRPKDAVVVPNLVLAPLSIIREWRDACASFVPRSLKVCELHELEIDTESEADASISVSEDEDYDDKKGPPKADVNTDNEEAESDTDISSEESTESESDDDDDDDTDCDSDSSDDTTRWRGKSRAHMAKSSKTKTKANNASKKTINFEALYDKQTEKKAKLARKREREKSANAKGKPPRKGAMIKSDPCRARRTPWERAYDYDIVLLAIHRTKDMSRELRTKVNWGYIVVDEAHKAVSNLSTITAQAISAINFKRRLVLTGTPLNNDLQELWSLLHFINPDIFCTQDSFEDVFRKPFKGSSSESGLKKRTLASTANTEERQKIAEEQRFQRQLEQDVALKEEEKQLLIMRMHQILRPFMLRRTKKDIDTTLRITFHEVKCPLTIIQKALLKLLREKKVLPHVIAEPKRRFLESFYASSIGSSTPPFSVSSSSHRFANNEVRQALMLSDRSLYGGLSRNRGIHLVARRHETTLCADHASMLCPHSGFVDHSATDSDTDVEEMPKSAAQLKALAASRPIKRYPHDPIVYATCQLRSVTTVTSTAQTICNHPFMIPFFSRLMAREAERQVARVINVYRKIRKVKELARIHEAEKERKRLAAAEKRRQTLIEKKLRINAIDGDTNQSPVIVGEAVATAGSGCDESELVRSSPAVSVLAPSLLNGSKEGQEADGKSSRQQNLCLKSPSSSPFALQKEEETLLRVLVLSLLEGVPIPDDLVSNPMVRDVFMAVAAEEDHSQGEVESDHENSNCNKNKALSQEGNVKKTSKNTSSASDSRRKHHRNESKASKPKCNDQSDKRSSAARNAGHPSSNQDSHRSPDLLSTPPLTYPFTSFNLSTMRSAEMTLSCSGKFIVLDMILRRLRLLNKKVVVFSHWLDCIDLLSEYLDASGWRGQHVVLTGTASAEDRKIAVDRFRTDPNMLVFVVSVKAGGCGLNLQVSNIVIMLDRDYTATNEDQAIARVFRIGQKNTVRAISLCTDDVAEARILAISDKKNKPREALIEGGGYNVGTTDSERERAVAESLKAKKHMAYSAADDDKQSEEPMMAADDDESAPLPDDVKKDKGKVDSFIDLSDLEKLSPLLYYPAKATVTPKADSVVRVGKRSSSLLPQPCGDIGVPFDSSTCLIPSHELTESMLSSVRFNRHSEKNKNNDGEGEKEPASLAEGQLAALERLRASIACDTSAVGDSAHLDLHQSRGTRQEGKNNTSSFSASTTFTLQSDLRRLWEMTHAFDRILIAESDHVAASQVTRDDGFGTDERALRAEVSHAGDTNSFATDAAKANTMKVPAISNTNNSDGSSISGVTVRRSSSCPAADILARSGITYRPLFQRFDWSMGLTHTTSPATSIDQQKSSSTGRKTPHQSISAVPFSPLSCPLSLLRYETVPLLITRGLLECAIDLEPSPDGRHGTESSGLVSAGRRRHVGALREEKGQHKESRKYPKPLSDLSKPATHVDHKAIVSSCWLTEIIESCATPTRTVPLLLGPTIPSSTSGGQQVENMTTPEALIGCGAGDQLNERTAAELCSEEPQQKNINVVPKCPTPATVGRKRGRKAEHVPVGEVRSDTPLATAGSVTTSTRHLDPENDSCAAQASTVPRRLLHETNGVQCDSTNPCVVPFSLFSTPAHPSEEKSLLRDSSSSPEDFTSIENTDGLNARKSSPIIDIESFIAGHRGRLTYE